MESYEYFDQGTEWSDLIVDSCLESKLEFTKNCPQISTGKYNILDSLEDIPEDVIAKAKSNITERESISGKKVRNDAKNTFIQVYGAYIDCGYNNFDPKELSEKLNLSRKDLNWCLKIQSGTSLTNNFQDEEIQFASIVILSPVAYIESKCVKNNLEKYTEEIKSITRKILEEKDILYSSRPEYVACSIIKVFCDVRKIPIKCFSKNNDISDNALKKCIGDLKEFLSYFFENKNEDQ